MRYTLILVIVLLTLVAGCGGGQAEIDAATHEAALLEWRIERLERLKSPTGYLNLAGLFWLEPGSNSFGSAADSDFVFPEMAPANMGEFVLNDDGVFMRIADGVDVYWDDTPMNSGRLEPDTSDNPMLIRHDSLAWMVIERAGQFGVRLRDYAHPAVESFAPIESFPIDASYRVEAILRPYDEPRIMNVETVIEGLGYHPQSPGTVEFRVAGRKYDLEAYDSEDQLFFVFGDRTSGRETYPAGRFLYADKPGEDGKTVLDFNYAYNPPCAFNDFATCPVASPRNRLAVRIEAGEKYDAKVFGAH
ncbi:MAG: DUF1684 domain-containing protein [Woeseiaceae bacterium]|nr:DUF1684 domain-containing protein [Woeseiaceae bacterium]